MMFAAEEITVAEIEAMLNKPTVNGELPKEFNSAEEANHLFELISSCHDLKEYIFDEFIFAGGTGMVFKVKRNDKESFFTALKVVRKKIYEGPEPSFGEEELDALKDLVHANILRQYEFIEEEGKGVVAICSALISNPQGMDKYIETILNKTPKHLDTYHQISPERLSHACEIIIFWFYQIALALQYMHEKGYGHLDIKPVNILLDKSGDDFIPILADMGSCIKLKNSKQKRGHFTWTYAHPELRDLASNPDSIKKHGLRASAEIKDHGKVVSYDLYALGKTIQQILAIIENHFGEMSYSDYSFRYMHIISALLLDGKNSIDASKKRENVFERDRIEFITDFPMGLHDSVFVEKKITSAKVLVERLKRHSHDYSISALAEEFGMRNSQIINNTIGEMVPFSKRVSKVFNHPIVKRLYGELQLGIMTEVYPGASHNRWSHSVGVYSLVLKYYISLLSDPDNPLLRIIIDKSDIDHAIIASILHDVGQTALCHDMEMVNNTLFNHMSFIQDLVDEEYLASAPLSKTINDKDNSLWGEIDFKRVISIINGNSSNLIDYVASDMINSPIDADKLDYIMRDSYYCGVAYGDGIDISRILNSLTVKEEKGKIRLAYYTKGRTAISSMLLARYQLYGAVYWHHTFRCLHAMIFYATQLAFGQNKPIFQINSKVGLSEIQMRKLYYYRVICKRPWNDCWDRMHKNFNSAIFNNIPAELKDEFSIGNNDYALDLIYKFTNKDGKALLKNIINRDLFKRIYSKSLFDIGVAEFPDLQNQCKDRVRVSKDIQKKLLEAARDEQTKSQRTETAAEIIMSNELKQFESDIENQLLILVDFPLKITIPKNSWPTEVDDSTRKLQNYISNDSNDSTVILDSSNNLLTQLACLRIYSEPAFFRVITRYLTPGAIEACVKNVITVF